MLKNGALNYSHPYPHLSLQQFGMAFLLIFFSWINPDLTLTFPRLLHNDFSNFGILEAPGPSPLGGGDIFLKINRTFFLNF